MTVPLQLLDLGYGIVYLWDFLPQYLNLNSSLIFLSFNTNYVFILIKTLLKDKDNRCKHLLYCFYKNFYNRNTMEAMPNTLQNSFKLIEKKKDTILTELYSIQQVLKKFNTALYLDSTRDVYPKVFTIYTTVLRHTWNNYTVYHLHHVVYRGRFHMLTWVLCQSSWYTGRRCGYLEYGTWVTWCSH